MWSVIVPGPQTTFEDDKSLRLATGSALGVSVVVSVAVSDGFCVVVTVVSSFYY